MAFENPTGPLTFLCSTGIKQYTFVDINSSQKLIKPVAGIAKAIGVVISSGTTNGVERVQTVQILGVAKVIGGSASIVAGSVVMAATDGRAEVASTNSTKMYMGRALLRSTSTSAQVISVLLQPGGLI